MKYQIQEITAISSLKLYNKNNLKFDYVTKEQFEDLKEQNLSNNLPEPIILGSIDLKETNKNNVDILIIESNNRTFQFEIENEKNINLMGYIYIGNNTFIAIKKNYPILFILLIIAGLCIIGAISIFAFKNQNGQISDDLKPADLNIANGQEWDGQFPQNGELSEANTESIEIPGYAEIHLSNETPELQLINPEGNTVYFVYTIKDSNNNIIYESEAIEPNKMISVNMVDLLDIGEHTLFFSISTYDIDTKTPCNGATQEVLVVVNK